MLAMGAKYGNIPINEILSGAKKIGGDVLNKEYEKKMEEVKKDLLAVKRAGTTMDFGKEGMTGIDFVDLTVHYVNEDWEMERRLLYCEEFPHASKTSENIKNFQIAKKNEFLPNCVALTFIEFCKSSVRGMASTGISPSV